MVNLLFQVYEIELLVDGTELGLDFAGDMGTGQHARVRRLRFIVDAFDFAALSHFLLELHDGQEEVDVEVQEFIQLVEQLELGRRIEAQVADIAPHDRPVFLFDMGVVVLVPRRPRVKVRCSSWQ